MNNSRACHQCKQGWPWKKGDGYLLCPSCESTSAYCSICSTVKDRNEFHKNKSRRTGVDTRCRACAVGYELQRRYGIDVAQYALLFEAQDGKCAICNLPSPEGQPLVVDHCHVGLQVRGLLCSPCNTAIGLLKDNPSVIRSAAAYVTANQAA